MLESAVHDNHLIDDSDSKVSSKTVSKSECHSAFLLAAISKKISPDKDEENSVCVFLLYPMLNMYKLKESCKVQAMCLTV